MTDRQTDNDDISLHGKNRGTIMFSSGRPSLSNLWSTKLVEQNHVNGSRAAVVLLLWSHTECTACSWSS